MLDYSIYELLWMFVIYAFLGWCLEVVFAMSQNGGKFVNRGFLNGPICPIYGFGALAVIVLLTPFKDNLLLLFAGSLMLTTVVEFIAGYILEKSFHQKWWDYSECFLNIKGYICASASVAWGVICILVIYFLHPLVDDFLRRLPFEIGSVIISLFILFIIVDTVVTIISLIMVKQKIHNMEDIMAKIEYLSGMVNKNIADNATAVKKMHGNNLQELNNLRKKYRSILNKKTVGYIRIAEAFPDLRLVKPTKSKDKSK